MKWDVQSFDEINRRNILAAKKLIDKEFKPSNLLKIGDIWAKLENTNPTGAFKIRGGLIYFEWLRTTHPEITTVVAATRGNHGQSVAYAARKAGLRSRIVIPIGNNPGKNRAMKELGTELIEHGLDFAEALDFAAKESEKPGYHFVPSFDWKLVLGVSTYSYDLFSLLPDLDTVFVPIGLGSGICGAFAARKALNLKMKIIGVVAENAPAYAQSFAAGTVIPGKEIPNTIADGVACRIPNTHSFNVIQRFAENVITVPEDEIQNAVDVLYKKTGFHIDGAGAIAFAAWNFHSAYYKNAAVIISGGNPTTFNYLHPPI